MSTITVMPCPALSHVCKFNEQRFTVLNNDHIKTQPVIANGRKYHLINQYQKQGNTQTEWCRWLMSALAYCGTSLTSLIKVQASF